MSLTNVDEQKLSVILIRFVKSFEVDRLATEGRSGVAAENQYDRPLAAKVRQRDRAFPSRIGQREVRRDAVSYTHLTLPTI